MFDGTPVGVHALEDRKVLVDRTSRVQPSAIT